MEVWSSWSKWITVLGIMSGMFERFVASHWSDVRLHFPLHSSQRLELWKVPFGPTLTSTAMSLAELARIEALKPG